MKMAKVFYAQPDDALTAGWYYSVDLAPPKGPFGTQIEASLAARAEIIRDCAPAHSDADLREALKPFALAADDLDDKTRDTDEIWEMPAAMAITAGNLRKAREAIASQGPAAEADEIEAARESLHQIARFSKEKFARDHAQRALDRIATAAEACEDERDVEIARRRLAEIEKDPGSPVEGEELSNRLAALDAPALSDRELAAVLAGLRLLQSFNSAAGLRMIDRPVFGEYPGGAWRLMEDRIAMIADIAENDGTALNVEEIDALCERLNTGGGMDREIDAPTAAHVQATARKHRQLLTWTVTWGTSDKGERFTCRPQIVSAGRVDNMLLHLAADTLEGIHAKLPSGLTRTEPAPGDDPVIVEVWL